MLAVSGLSKRFDGKDVIRDVDLALGAGEVMGLIGRSGAGKSTIARCIVGLERPEQGEVYLDAHPIAPGHGTARRDIQYLWQDPTQSLSPYLSAHDAVLETLNGFAIGPAAGRPDQAEALLSHLGIAMDAQRRRPHFLSGGQCQRVALARALAAEPKVLILDEPLSSLDLTAQVATVELLRRVHAETGATMLIVSHDLAPLRHLATRIAVLDAGRIVEYVAMDRFEEEAHHPLSRAYADTIRGGP